MELRQEIGMRGPKNYRELQPVRLWGANIEVDDLESFKNSLVQAAQQVGKNQFGYFIFPQNEKAKYHLGRYPRRKYGSIPTDEQMRQQLDIILNTTHQRGEEEQTTIQPKFKVVLGLEEGYGTGKFHKIEDIASIVGNKFYLTPAEIFTIKAQDGRYDTYQEPAVRIEGSLAEIKIIYKLAERLKQERFTVDDFSQMTSHIVETSLCSSPDIE